MDEDKKLLEAVLYNKDYVAFGKLIEKYKQDVFAYVYRVTGNYHLSEDILQETFIKVFKYLKSFDLDKEFLPWLLKIAKNVAYTQLRKQKIYYFQEKEIVSNVSSEKQEGFFLRKRVFLDLLEGLSEEEKELIILRFVLDLQHRQISEITGLKETTIRSKISRSLKKLRNKLDKKDGM
jgi:RNA polymerase sigma-70 factor (ECF subfamily)